MLSTVKAAPKGRIVGLLLAAALLLTPLFAQTANASTTLDNSGASYGEIPEMDDSGATDDLFGKRKKKKTDVKVLCQQIQAQLEHLLQQKTAFDNASPNALNIASSKALQEGILSLLVLYNTYDCGTVLQGG